MKSICSKWGTPNTSIQSSDDDYLIDWPDNTPIEYHLILILLLALVMKCIDKDSQQFQNITKSVLKEENYNYS